MSAGAVEAPSVEVAEAERVEVVVPVRTPRGACEAGRKNGKSCCCYVCWGFTLLFFAYIAFGVISGEDKTATTMLLTFVRLLRLSGQY